MSNTRILAQDPPDRNSSRALAILIAGALAIALSPIMVRMADVGPTTAAFWRVALAVPALMVLLPVSADRQVPRREGMPYGLIALAGIFFAGDLFCWHIAITWTTVANATLLANFTPIIVTLFAWLLFGQRPARRFMVCLGVGLAGAILLTGGNPLGSAEALKGDLVGLVTACFYGAYLLTVSRLRLYCTTMQIMAYSALVTAILLLPAAVVLEDRLLPLSLHGWIVLAILALVSHAAGQGMIAFALAHLTASFSSLALLVQPVAAACLAWILFGEAIAPIQALGGAIILASVAVARTVRQPVPADR